MANETHKFRVKARLLRLLGDELIRDASLAVFELVKNAYDADATRCTVTLRHPSEHSKAEIFIEDNGAGMSVTTIRDVWLVIATSFRAEQRAEKQRTKLGRFPLGEKGLGRLAVHKLGHRITLISREAGAQEVVVEINWDELEAAEDLTKTGVTVATRTPVVFKGKTHGTKVEVRRLREEWDRAKVRSLHRAVTSLCSPFEGPDKFDVSLKIEPRNDWLVGLLDAKEVRKCALYHAKGYFQAGEMVYDYEFIPPPGSKASLKTRKEPELRHPLQRKPKDGRKLVPLDLSKHAIGRVGFDFYIFDREPGVLKAVTDDVRGLQSFLNENGGIRIYREGVRVFDFGEPGNDWLNLDGRRVNKPMTRISNNQILGELLLDAEKSTALKEKSNREGFLENEAYADFQDAVISVLTQVEADRQADQKIVRQFYSRRGPHKPVVQEIAELREELKRRGVLEELEPQIARVEKQLEAYQETMLRASVPGLTFASLIHGAEKVLKELVGAVRGGAALPKIRKLVEQLDAMMSRLGNLVRGAGSRREKASTLITDALFNVEFRLAAHKLEPVNGLTLGNPDFAVTCTPRLIVGTLTNLLDNSIYWLQFARASKHKIFLGTSTEIPGGPSIIVADNGPGLQDNPEMLVEPFFSRRPDGMGLGLYLADEVMRLHQGHLRFPQKGDIDIPHEFTGAIIALQFPPK